MYRLSSRFPNFGCATVQLSSQLFAYFVSDETVPDKTEVCNFFSKADANKTAVMSHLRGEFGAFLYSACTRAVEGACGSHLRPSSMGVIRDSSEASWTLPADVANKMLSALRCKMIFFYCVQEKPKLHLEICRAMSQAKYGYLETSR